MQGVYHYFILSTVSKILNNIGDRTVKQLGEGHCLRILLNIYFVFMIVQFIIKLKRH